MTGAHPLRPHLHFLKYAATPSSRNYKRFSLTESVASKKMKVHILFFWSLFTFFSSFRSSVQVLSSERNYARGFVTFLNWQFQRQVLHSRKFDYLEHNYVSDTSCARKFGSKLSMTSYLIECVGSFPVSLTQLTAKDAPFPKKWRKKTFTLLKI